MKVSHTSSRSKYAVDVMWRLWDTVHSRFITNKSRSIWTQKSAVERIRDEMVAKHGRTPETLNIERVFVQIA